MDRIVAQTGRLVQCATDNAGEFLGALANRLQVSASNDRLVSQRFGLEGRLSVVLNAVYRRITRLLLNVVALSERRRVIRSPSATHLNDRSEVFLSFSNPDLIVCRVRVGRVRFVTNRLQGGDLRVLM